MNKIEKIISKYWKFSTFDVEASTSPCINSIWKDTFQLAKYFYKNEIEAVTYIKSNNVDRTMIKYMDLNEDIIDEILYLAEIFQNLKEEIE